MTQSEVVQIDKRFVVVIVAILIQAAGIVWAASAMWSSLDELRETDARLEAADVQIRLEANAREARLRAVEQAGGRMETKLEAIVDGIERLNTQMERLIERQTP
jgi:TolA-binding protein